MPSRADGLQDAKGPTLGQWGLQQSQAPPAHGGPQASIALLQQTMAPLSEQLTQPAANRRQRKAENTAATKDNFNALL